MSEVKRYKYFDTPDGHDVDKKFACFMRPISYSAGGIALADVVLLSKPKGYLPVIGRLAYISGSLIAAGATFVLTTNALAGIRKDNGKLNWFLGGFAAGPIFGALNRNRMIGFNLGLLFGITAFLVKYADEANFVIFPPKKFQHSGLRLFDCSIMQERPRTWKTSRD